MVVIIVILFIVWIDIYIYEFFFIFFINIMFNLDMKKVIFGNIFVVKIEIVGIFVLVID